MKQYAIHSVEYLKGGKIAVAKPGETFDVSDDSAEALKKLGASRDLTEDEKILEAHRVKAAVKSDKGANRTEPEKTEDEGGAKTARRTPKTAKGTDEDI